MKAKELSEKAQDSLAISICDISEFRNHLRKEASAGCIIAEQAIEKAEEAAALLAKLHGYERSR